jgi:hypothetical protein
VLGIREPDELAREIEPYITGLQVHRLFGDLYRDVDMSNPEPSLLEKRLTTLLHRYFADGLFYSREEDFVKRILNEKLLVSLHRDIMRFREGYRIRQDFIEKNLQAEIGGGRYKIGGRIDRVDQSPTGSYVLIDYKTGAIPSARLHFEETGYGEVQLGIYGLLLRYEQPDASIESLCYFDLGGECTLKPVVQGDEVEAYLNSFESHLIEFLDRFSVAPELALAENRETCALCPYDVICRILET